MVRDDYCETDVIEFIMILGKMITDFSLPSFADFVLGMTKMCAKTSVPGT